MKRCKTEKELDLMLPESNEKNLKNFKRLLPHFYYDYDSEKYLKSILGVKTSFDDMLITNNQQRAWFEIPKNLVPVSKSSMSIWESLINRIYTSDSPDARDFIAHYAEDNRSAEEILTSGKLNINGQYVKLFKYLLKKGLTDKTEVESITSQLNGSKKLYLCLSKNPIDMLFCSTNQSFSSCMSLNSDYESCYYMSLGSVSLEIPRGIAFIASGKIRRYTLKGLEFKHFKYHSRSWIIKGESAGTEIIHVVKPYPTSCGFDYRKLIENATGITTTENPHSFESELFEQIRFEDRNFSSRAYCDSTIGYRNCKGKTQLIYDGHGNNFDFDWRGGFEDIAEFSNLYGDGTSCGSCGGHCDIDDMHEYDGVLYCESCFFDENSYCTGCGNAFLNDEGVFTDYDGYCEYCADNLGLGYCDICGHGNELTLIGSDRVCQGCIDRHYSICDYCDELIHEDDINSDGDKLFCDDCSDHHYNEIESEVTSE